MIDSEVDLLLYSPANACRDATDLRPELRYSPFQQTPDRRMVDGAVRVSELVPEGDDRARIRDVGGQLRLVLRGQRAAPHPLSRTDARQPTATGDRRRNR